MPTQAANICVCVGWQYLQNQPTDPWSCLLEGPLLPRHSTSTKSRDHYIFQYTRWVLKKRWKKKKEKGKKKKKHQFSPHFPLSEKEKTTVPHPAFSSHYSNGFIASFPIHWYEKLMVSRHQSPSLLVYNTSLGQEMHITHQTTWLHQYPFYFGSIGFQGYTSPIWK